MAAGDTRIIISAVDQTQAAVASAERGLNSLKTSFGSLRTVIGTITGLGAVTMFTQWATGSIAAASALDDLADATGSSVESLSKLANIATVSGASFETIDTAIKKLAVGMAGVDEESSRAGKALAAIGVQSRDPAQALTEIAQKFAAFEDGANKAALAVAIFGKSGASLLPVLKDIAENVDIAGTVTAQQAKAAEDLEKVYARLGVQSTTFKNILLSDVVPALTATITSFNLARAAGLGFLDALLLTGNYGPDGIAAAVKKAADEVDRWRKAEASAPSESWAEAYARNLDAAEKKLKALKAIQDSMNRPAWDAAYPSRNSSGRQTEAPTIPGGDPAKAKAATDYYLKGLDDIAAAMKEEEKLRAARLEQIDKEQAALLKLYEADRKGVEELDKTTASYQQQIDALTMTEDAILGKERARLHDILTDRLASTGADDYTAALERQLETLDKLRGAKGADEAAKAAQKAADDWQKAADSIRDSLTDALLRGFESGKDFAANFADTLKNMFSTLVLRPIIQGILAPVAGGLGGLLGSGNAAASGLGSVGNLFGGGSLLNLGGIGDAIFGGGGGAAFGAGVSSPFSTLGAIFSGVGEFAAPGMALASGLGAAVPIIGAALAVASMFGAFSSKGGPKQAGTAGYGGFYPGETSATGNSAVQTIVTATEASYKQLLSGLGGSGSAAFTLGYDTDPAGSADSRVSAGALVNGQSVYSLRDLDVGRDEESLKAALETESKRALLAALQASDLPAQIAAVFDTVAAESASSAEIDNLLAFGAAMKVVVDAVGGDVMQDAQKAWEKSQRGTLDVLRDMGAEVVKLAKGMDGSLESMQALATATGDFRAAVAQTLVAIRQMAAQVADMFAQTTASITTFGMTPEELYAYYAADFNSAAQELATTTDPARVNVLAARLNDDINAAWAALPNEQKLAMRPAFLQWITQSGELSAGAFGRAGEAVAGLTVDPFAAANAALDGAAAKFSAAANTQATAADINMAASQNNLQASNNNLAASRTPVTVQLISNFAEVGG